MKTYHLRCLYYPFLDKQKKRRIDKISKKLNDIERALIDFALSLGNNLVLQDNPTYLSSESQE